MVKRRGSEFGIAVYVTKRREEFGIERSKLLDEIEMLVMSGDLPRVSIFLLCHNFYFHKFYGKHTGCFQYFVKNALHIFFLFFSLFFL